MQKKPIGNQTFRVLGFLTTEQHKNGVVIIQACHACLNIYMILCLYIYIFKFSFSDTLLLMCNDCLKISTNSFAIYTILIYFDNRT